MWIRQQLESSVTIGVGGSTVNRAGGSSVTLYPTHRSSRNLLRLDRQVLHAQPVVEEGSTLDEMCHRRIVRQRVTLIAFLLPNALSGHRSTVRAPGGTPTDARARIDFTIPPGN
jgi:hypothetical protein